MRWLAVALAASVVALGCQTAPLAPVAPASSLQASVAPDPTPRTLQAGALDSPLAPHSRAPSASERRHIRALMRETERLRGLRFTHEVEVRIQDREAMRAYVASELREDELTLARDRYVALGLLEPELDVREVLETLMEEELIGYYDPKRKHLAIRDDVAARLGGAAGAEDDLEWRATVVHELVHALQDQHLGLAAALRVERSTDADNAFGGLIEGDATLAMLAYVAELSGITLQSLVTDRRRLRSMLVGARDSVTGALSRAPTIVREPLLFRYREGALYVAELVRAGGWRGVDAAHRQAPGSTQQLLDFRRASLPDGTRPIRLPTPSRLAAAGYHSVDEDSLGQFELGLYLGGDSQRGARAARAWRADRYRVLEREGQLASMWVIETANPRSARRVRALASRAQERREKRAVPYRAHSQGAYVFIVRGLEGALSEAVMSELVASAASPH